MKRGTIVTGIWLLPNRRRKDATALEDARRKMFGQYCNSEYPYPLECQYGYYGGHPSHWNFGLVCVSRIAAEAGCDLVVYTDAFSESVLRHPSHHNVINAHPFFTRNMSEEITSVWNSATVRHFELESSSLLPIEKEIQHKYNRGNIRGTAEAAIRDLRVPYYNVVVLEKPRIALDAAIQSQSEQVYWIDTHMWYSNAHAGLSAKSIDEVVQVATGDYFNKMYNVMKERPSECCFIDAGGMTIAGGVFGGTKSGMIDAMSVYANEAQAQVGAWVDYIKDRELAYEGDRWIGDILHGRLVDTMMVQFTEQALLTRLYREQKIKAFVSFDSRQWDFHLWPTLIEQTHRTGR